MTFPWVGIFHILLMVANVSAEVVSNFHSSPCREFFYEGVSPVGIPAQDPKHICQLIATQAQQMEYQYATYYDKARKIPVYSAYTLPTLSRNCPASQRLDRTSWYIECELAGLHSQWQEQESICAGRRIPDNTALIADSQARNSDYTGSGYDRGHLNPNAHQCGERRFGTFTLTNAVPQPHRFNSPIWYNGAEQAIQTLMSNRCNFFGVQRYVITGAVPGSTTIGNNVNVPSHVWSAVCCDASAVNDDLTFFQGYIGNNVATGSVTVYSDDKQLDFLLKLESLYHSNSIKLFGTGGCTMNRRKKKQKVKSDIKYSATCCSNVANDIYNIWDFPCYNPMDSLCTRKKRSLRTCPCNHAAASLELSHLLMTITALIVMLFNMKF